MLAWRAVTQSVYECVDKVKRRIEVMEDFKLLTVQCFLSSRSWGGVEEEESMYSLSVCNARGRAPSASPPVFFVNVSRTEEEMNKSTERRGGRCLRIPPLRYPEVLVFSDGQSTHWSWSWGRSSLWLGRRGPHWTQHWRGCCHLKKKDKTQKTSVNYLCHSETQILTHKQLWP